jgi:Lipid A 3-O-deacylase (PagL)
MQNKLFFFLQFIVLFIFSTNSSAQSPDYSFVGLEYSIGKTSTANVNFPSLSPQQGILFTIGSTNNDDQHEWKRQLNHPETGVTFSYVSLGNSTQLGNTFSVVPYIDFKVFNKWSSRYNLKVGLGASYFSTIYDEIENPNNKAISTHFTWAFRSNLYYKLLKSENYKVKLGLGYFHNSNGHTRLPNNGLNTFLFSIYSQLNFNKKEVIVTEDSDLSHGKTSQRYFTTRFGLGQRVLSKYNNDSKDVYAFSASTGKIINKTFKYGYGLYYRLYKDYYDYINENGALVAELYPEYRDNATWNASNIGVFGSGELLLSHFGIEFELGINLHKPSYKFDWQINEEKYVDGQYQLGELNWYYNIKKTISSRLGAKLYAINTNKAPQHNVFLGAFINSNFGQADFSELTLGYVYSLPIKERNK